MESFPHGWIGTLFAALIGLCVGSYANVVIYRSPRDGLSSFRPARSFCPGCRRQLSWSENVPVLSWLVQRGRCRGCGMSIPFRYPAVELVIGALFVAAWRLAPPVGTDGWVALLVAWYLAAACVIVSLIDLEHLIIPDTITWPGMLAGLAASAAFPVLHAGQVAFRPDTPHASSLVAGFAGLLAGGGSLAGVGALGNIFLKRKLAEAGVQDAMGWGDVKWMALAGAFLGTLSVLSAILIGCFAGALVGIGLKLAARLRGVDAPAGLPFGPFLSIGILAELVSPELAWTVVDRIARPA